jgi:hypothetical protein
MSDKLPCEKCGAMILPTTAQSTGGLCMPCKKGFRQDIETSKRYYEEQKKYDPFRELWKSLVQRVYETDSGFEGLNADEKIYFSVSVLEGEVYNGGFDQFFWNSSGNLFHEAVSGLEAIGACSCLDLLLQAKQAAFPDGQPPRNCEERRTYLRLRESESQSALLNEFDRVFWKDPDKLQEKLVQFATEKGLVTPFLK